MIWTTGYEWLGRWFIIASVLTFFLSLIVLLIPLVRRLCGVIPPKTRPDTPIHEAIDYIVNDSSAALRSIPPGYDHRIVSKFEWQGEKHHHALELIREKAIFGEMRIWGRIQIGEASAMTFDNVLHEIPTEYWQLATFNTLFCFHSTGYNQTSLMSRKHKGPLYAHITLSRSQIVSIWPNKPIWRRKLKRGKRLAYRAS